MNNSTDDNVDIDQILEETEAFLRELDKLLGHVLFHPTKNRVKNQRLLRKATVQSDLPPT